MMNSEAGFRKSRPGLPHPAQHGAHTYRTTFVTPDSGTAPETSQ